MATAPRGRVEAVSRLDHAVGHPALHALEGVRVEAAGVHPEVEEDVEEEEEAVEEEAVVVVVAAVVVEAVRIFILFPFFLLSSYFLLSLSLSSPFFLPF